MDPIDGTKGFLRGGQYAVCLGLLLDGKVVVGVMGCPNLPVDHNAPEGEKGVIFVAVKGQGAFQVRRRIVLPYWNSPIAAIEVPHVVDAHSNHHVDSLVPLVSVILRIGRSSSFGSFHQRAYRQITRHHQTERAHGLAS